MGKLICVDAGHGGTDSGASGNGIFEKNVTLKAALILGEALKKQDFDVVFTRVADNYVGLGERCRIANENAADLFISIHFNYSDNVNALGTETLCYSKNKLAEIVQKFIIDTVKTKDRGVKERKDLYVLNSTKMNAILIELAFLSNQNDASLVKKESFFENSAEAVTRAVCKYFNVTFKENEGDLEVIKNIDVIINGKKSVEQGYFSDGKNLFTADFLRKIGFNVSFDKNTKAVVIDNNDVRNIKIIVNGEEKEVSSILRDDFNFIKLRDLENIGVFQLRYDNGVIYADYKD